MGRRAEGFRFLKRGGIWSVRFRIRGARHEYSTGIKAEPKARQPSEGAVRAGEQIYAAALAGKRIGKVAAGGGGSGPSGGAALAELFAEWLDDLTVREPTREQYEVFSVQWLREWRLVRDMTEPALASYFRRRLREVRRKSVANEASAMRRFGKWALDTGLLDAAIEVPAMPAGTSGTPFAVRRRVKAPDLSPKEIEAFLALLPERSASRIRAVKGFVVRARFIVMFDTTLRPETLNKLSIPEHWAPGEKVIRVTDSIDKEGMAREVPLTPRAIAALESIAPEAGLVFGKHKYFRYTGPAAKAVLPPSKAAIFTGQHVRSAAITRALERSTNMPGVMHMAGHRNAGTTSKYARPSFRAAQDVIGAFLGEVSGEKPRRRGAK